MRFRAKYQDLVCPACRGIDELAALRRGIEGDAIVPRKPTDLLLSSDGFYVVSNRMAKVLKQAAKQQAEFFKLPGSKTYSVLYPTTVFDPPANLKVCSPMQKLRKGEVFQLWEGPCERCGRSIDMSWRSERFVVPSAIALAGVRIEQRPIAGVPVVISNELRAKLKDACLTGW